MLLGKKCFVHMLLFGYFCVDRLGNDVACCRVEHRDLNISIDHLAKDKVSSRHVFS